MKLALMGAILAGFHGHLAAQPQMQTFAFWARPTERVLVMPGQGQNIFVARVNINGQEAAYAEGSAAQVDVYGSGVVVSITQRGRQYRLTAVALQPTRVTIRYRLSG